MVGQEGKGEKGKRSLTGSTSLLQSRFPAANDNLIFARQRGFGCLDSLYLLALSFSSLFDFTHLILYKPIWHILMDLFDLNVTSTVFVHRIMGAFCQGSVTKPLIETI